MTAHSSPFSSALSPYTPSPADSSSLSLPMRSRQVSYNAPYNPQEWGPIGGGGGVSSPSIGLGAFTPAGNPMRSSVAQGPADIGTPPPPPYSPRRPEQREAPGESPQLTMSPTVVMSPAPVQAQYNPPVTSAPQEPPSGYQYGPSRPRPLSLVYNGDRPVAVQDSYIPPSSNAGGQSSQYILQNASRPAQGAYGVPTHDGHANPMSPTRITHEITNQVVGNPSMMPPASRRAASTGALEANGHSSRAGMSDSWIHHRTAPWAPGMPLPPPPPGPPPATPHIQQRGSSQGPARESGIGRDRRRSPPRLGTTLGDIPPTPAGWVDESATRHANQSSSVLTETRQPTPDSHRSRANSHVSASRPPLLTNQSHSAPPVVNSGGESATTSTNTKGIRERRIESRHERNHSSAEPNRRPNHEDTDGNSDNAWPADLVLPNPGGPGLSRRRTVTKSTPRSARSFQSDDQPNPSSSKSPFGVPNSASSSYSTPRPQRTPTPDQSGKARGYAQTPPFSPGSDLYSPSPPTAAPPNIPPKALPTPPLQGSQDPRSTNELSVNSPDDRPVSHLLHLPIEGSSNNEPLVPDTPIQRAPSTRLATAENDKLVRDAIQRHQDFVEKEVAASTERDALTLFADYIVSECKIRTQRYTNSGDDDLFDIQGLREKLFERILNWSARPKGYDTRSEGISSAGPSVPNSPDVHQRKPESGWWNNYKPSLSPIASMSMSNDEMSSRGRPSSRWWESQTGSDGGGGAGQRVQRSKQESKYMGVPREMREAMQLEHPLSNSEVLDYSNPAPMYGPNEYPPEKVGLHEPPRARSLSVNREAKKLDISRFVTLPPPYPRHYPAVNNSHPDLVFFRTAVRSLSDLKEIQNTKQEYETEMKNFRHEHQLKVAEKRRVFRLEMNNRIEQGTISYAEAADTEAVRRMEEQSGERKLLQTEFDSYRESVISPLQSILDDRINIASSCIEDLRSKLFESAQRENPDQTQEEGDEQPELLEKLTQLKWLFEAREQLYREVFELQSERNEKYRALVSLPYKQAKNQEKMSETAKFFAQDAQERRLAFATETLRRYERFLDAIEENVGRGVELQLSAFWDIAPSLLAILQKIPENLHGFSVKIPSKEYEENPSYYRFPLQYLFSLLSHTEKSTYQFIESQTNLLCLLHEVKSGVMNANCLHMEVARIGTGELEEFVKEEMKESSEEEERRLTVDLKEKVAMVESQWAEALGNQLDAVKARVRDWLVREGGWDEMEQS
ncbi:hypothetical protein AJ80_09160 [Polytolypa hystricis UAMH7299]|uniref:Uncharacterized protein n=1 Tax=Polytolypa hystricis (strain UAMH7299) TaxID=1447883 RepID=A0A2B7WMG5_POLH7|nr:hypothetical protein AJ80_09160 [Polytolypa hystricis UAMH7299]